MPKTILHLIKNNPDECNISVQSDIYKEHCTKLGGVYNVRKYIIFILNIYTERQYQIINILTQCHSNRFFHSLLNIMTYSHCIENILEIVWCSWRTSVRSREHVSMVTVAFTCLCSQQGALRQMVSNVIL